MSCDGMTPCCSSDSIAFYFGDDVWNRIVWRIGLALLVLSIQDPISYLQYAVFYICFVVCIVFHRLFLCIICASVYYVSVAMSSWNIDGCFLAELEVLFYIVFL